MTATATVTASTDARSLFQLPEALHPYLDDLEAALTVELLMTWREGDRFHEARQPEAIGQVLIRALHSHLADWEIGYLYREEMYKGEKVRLAQASKVSGKLAHFANLDFLIEVNWTHWSRLSERERIALIDHELCHCVIESTNSGKDVTRILQHDVEEFSAIVRRWGLWRPDLKRFARAIEDGPQLGLFPEKG